MENSCVLIPYNKEKLKQIIEFSLTTYYDLDENQREDFVKVLHTAIINLASKEGMSIDKTAQDDIVNIFENIVDQYKSALQEEGISEDEIDTEINSFKSNIKIVKSNLIDTLEVPVNSGTTKVSQPESQNTTDQNNKPIKKQRIKIRNILKDIFGSSIGPKQYRQQLFSQDVFGFICAGTRLITNDKELNEAIAIQKNKYYKQILDYLQSIDYDIREFPPVLYNDDLTLNHGYEQVLRIYQEDILPNITKDQIRFGWASALKGEDNSKSKAFIVLNSYINLRYFDSLLKEKIGKVIGIDKDVEENVEVDASQKKYFFRTVINDLSKGWETQENQDALETTSRFSKMIIENIPMMNYNTGSKLNYNVTTTTFAGAFCNLFNTLINSNNSGGTESANVAITDYLFYMHRNPKKYVKQLLYKLFEGRGRDGLRKELLTKGLTEFDLNVLYSAYQFLFNKKTGLEKVELDYMRDKDSSVLPNQYPLIECVVGVVDRLMGINYLQYDLNNSGEMEISIKAKFRAKRKMYDLMNKVNRGIILRQDVERFRLQDKYNFKRINEKTWEFKIGESVYQIQATSDTLFTNKDATVNKIIQDENGQDKLIPIDFSKMQKSFDNISQDDDLKSFLEFIQDNLPGIRFVSDLDIEKLISSGNLSNTLLKEMFMSAARSGTVNKIHIDYINSKTDKVFSEWAEENFFELSGTLDKNFWTKSLGNLDLLVLRPYNTWIEYYVTGEAIIDGSIGQSTIKDMDGNSIGNFSTSYLGGNIFYYLKQSLDWRSDEDENIQSTHGRLLFARDSKLITGVVVNLDSKNQERNQKKLAKAMNVGELAEQSIFHNFFESYYGENEKTKGAFFIQPTTFSDKTKFVQYKIDGNTPIEFGPERLYYLKKLKDLGEEAILQLYGDTVGEFYKQEFSNTVNKLAKTFGLGPGFTYQDVLEAIETQINNNIKLKTKEDKEQALIDLARKNGVTLYLDSDYMINGNKIQFNPLLDYYNNYLFADIENLRKKFRREKINFVNDIISSNDIFYIKRLNGENTSIGNVIEKIFSVDKKDMKNEALYGFINKDSNDSALLQYNSLWVKKDSGRFDDKLILAKQVDENGIVIKEFIYGDLIPEDANVILNPLLENYFLTETTLSTNLRLSLTGSEIAHPIKWNNSEEIPNPLNRKNEGYYKDQMFQRIETLTQGAQLKRNVIIPATLQYFQQNTLRGVPNTLKIATIRDLKAPVFNFTGDSTMQDVSDGGGYSNSLITILENYSLQDQRVGTIKKTIAHSPNYSTGGSFLGKWAIFGITSETMRNSLNSDISLYELDKKLLNQQWYYENGELNEMIDKKALGENTIDLTQIISSKKTKKISTEGDFSQEILKGRRLFYRNPETNTLREIVNISKDETTGIYYTEEYDFSGGRRINKKREKVYHLFSENDSTHIKLTEEEFNGIKGKIQKKSFNHYSVNIDKVTNWHTINSNFELKESLGGLYSVSYDKENRNWEYSDTSSYATCEFLNLVAFRRDPTTKREFDQENYYQPLKDTMIHYAVNNSAVKNGAGNINQASAWKNKSPLSYMKVQYDGIGVQMDADHTADEALLTEFSQVISSLDALGNLHEHAKNIFKSLQKIARAASITEMEALDNFINNVKGHQDKRVQLLSDLYDVVGRAIINNFKNNNESSLAEDVIKLVKKHFDKSLQHSLDEYKIPFSDPGIFQGIIPVFASQINNKSVKRKYPGSGYVMCPGYNSRQLFVIDGYNYQFNDIVDLVKSFIKNNKVPELAQLYKRGQFESYVDWERRIVREFLKHKQSVLIKKSRESGNTGKDQFIPTDNVYVVVKDKEGNELPPIRISLSSVDDYVTFTSDYWWQLLFRSDIEGALTGDRNNYDLENAEFFQDIERGRDLAPSRITWKDVDGKQHNIFELTEVRKGFTASLSFYDEYNELVVVEVPNSFVKKSVKDIELFIEHTLGYKNVTSVKIQKNKQNRASVQKIFNDLSEGKFTRNGSNELEDAIDIQNKPSQVILSSMHKSKFPTNSLPYILRNHRSVFYEEVQERIEGSEKYDFTLVNPNNRHQYITFSEVKVSKKQSGARNDLYRYKKYVKETIPGYTNDQGKRVNKKDVILIYSMDQETSILQYPIGVLEEVKKITKDIYKNTDKKILNDGYIQIGDKIYKEEFFIKRYRIPHKFEVEGDNQGNKSKKTIHQTVYYINNELIRKYYGKYDKAGEIISKLYEVSGAKELRLNIDKVDSLQKSNQIRDILSSTKLQIDIEQGLINKTIALLQRLNNVFENPNQNITLQLNQAFEQEELTEEERNKIIEDIKSQQYDDIVNYYTSRSRYRYTSFLRSLEVIMSRIPAQSLQSFMKGEVVGFLNTSETHAYVSHWQLYLQGSDYDIDKSYIMGPSFNDGGMYYSWSPLFDFFSINTLHASEVNIPMTTPGKSINVVYKTEDIDVRFKKEKSIDITDIVRNIKVNTTEESSRIRNLELYGKILKLVEESKLKGVTLYIDENIVDQTIIDDVINKLNKHFKYVPTEAVRENAIKNQIQSGIGHVVQHLRNMIHAYSPITMDELRQNPRNAKIMSLMNPMTKYVMQVQNMIGKDVIGISAVGEKVFFTLTYYWNEQLRRGDIENLKFNKTFTRILNRKEDNKVKQGITNIVRRYEQQISQLPDEYDVSEMTQEESKEFLESTTDDEKKLVYFNVKKRKTDELRNLMDIQINIFRKSVGGLQKVSIDKLANVNFTFEGVEKIRDSFSIVNSVHDQLLLENYEVGSEAYTKEMLERLRIIQDNAPKADLFISQLLSAATDNAKELILAQINAGSDLAGIYMYLISLGFEIGDIVAFMTSPAMLTIHKLMQSNMFDQRSQQLSINDLIKILSGDFYKIDRSKKFNSIDSFRDYIYGIYDGTIELDGNDRFKLVIKTILNSLEGQSIIEFFKDIEELKNIIPGSQEHTNLGGIFLKLNQGLPTSQEDLLTKLQRISNLVQDRFNTIIKPAQFKKDLKNKDGIELSFENIKSGKIDSKQLKNATAFKELVEKIISLNPKLTKSIVENTLITSIFESYTNLKDEEVPPIFFEFNVRQWIQDDKYKSNLINLYNLIKDTWNIFDVVDKVPQYKELLNLLKLVYTCNDELVLKSRTLNIIHQKLLKKGEFLDDYSYSKLMEYVDDRIIYTFLTNELRDFTFAIPSDFGYLNSERLISQNDVEKEMNFNNNDGIANFKRFFEEYFIRNLTNPEFDATDLIGVESIANNDFIRNLVIDIDSKSGIPFFKLDINMMQIESGVEAQTLYETMVNGLEELDNIRYRGHSLTEWFMLYNLIVNKNRYGEDRLTTIFKSFIDSNKRVGDLYNRYYNFIGRIDHEYHDDLERVLGVNYNDIQLYMAPVVPEYLERYSKSKYIMQYVDGVPIYKYRSKSRDKYREITTGLSKSIITTRSQQEEEEIKKNSTLYYLRESPNFDNIQYFRDTLKSGEISQIIKALQLLESNEIILFKINC